MLSYTIRLVLPLLTCYVIVEGFYVTNEATELNTLTDTLLGYMAKDEQLRMMQTDLRKRLLHVLMELTANSGLTEPKMTIVEPDNKELLESAEDDFSNNDMSMSKREPCHSILIGGPFMALLCNMKRNQTTG